MQNDNTAAAAGRHESTAARIRRYVYGNFFIAVSTIFWGINYPFTKALIPHWMDASALSVVRLAGGAALFWLASLFTKNEKIDKDDLYKAALGGFIGLFGCIYLFILALNYGSAIDIAIIMTLPPAFVILMETLFLHRHPSLMEYAGIVISFIGAALVITGSSSSSATAPDALLGDFLAILASMGFAFYLVILSKPTVRYHPVTLLRWVFLFSALPALFLAPNLIEAPLMHCREITPWLQAAFILFCPTFLAYLLVQPASKDIGSVLVSLYQYLTPVVAAWSAIIMGVDTLHWQQATAMLIIIAGMILTNFSKIHSGHKTH